MYCSVPILEIFLKNSVGLGQNSICQKQQALLLAGYKTFN